ncbi:MAG TPA: TolC family protein [Armatimonadota bacterium]|jgi:TolC family type I secretion outer membrane protein
MLQRIFKTVIVLAAAQALPGSAAPPVALPSPLTLDAAVRIGLANHNQIGIAVSQKDAAAARVTEAKSAWFPQITPVFQHTTQKTLLNSGTSTQDVSSIGLQQTIFDSGKRELNIARSRDSVRSAAYNVQDVRQSVVLNVTTGWFELLRAKDLVRVAESGVDRAKTTLDATRAFAEAGSSPRKDVLQAQADYDNAQVQSIQARNTVRLAETTLRNAMGASFADPIVTPETAVPTPPVTPEARTIADFVDQAMRNRPDLRGSELGISSNRKGVKIAAIEAGPQVQADLNEGYRIHPDSGENHTITATISYPLFDAGASRARVREARATLTQSEQQLELARQDAAANVESAYLLREEARQRVSATQTALTASKENYAAATESRNEGVGTILDVITAENQLVTAETNAVQAVYDYHTADARLMREIGANDPVAGGGQS